MFSNLLKVLFCNMENMIFFQFLINIPCSFFDRFPCVKGYEKLNSVIIKLRSMRSRSDSLVVYIIGGPIQCVVSYRDQCAHKHTS